MLAIVTAFRSQLLAQDWEHHVWLLQRTLDSILAQTNDAFIAVVVCHEQPRIPHVLHPKVCFLQVDFPPPQRNNDDMCADKVLKLSVGAEWAVVEGCDYIMFTDADDLVNRQVSQYVAAHRGANGWYTPSEFYYAYGSRWIRKNSRPPMVSGPCVIVRSDLLKFATNPFKGFWLNLIMKGGERAFAEQLASRNRRINTLAAVGLAHFQKLMTNEGAPLEPLPFTSNVVINHLDSTSQVAGGLGTSVPLNRTARLNLRSCLNRLKRVGLCLPSVLPLTQALREEFTIPAPNAVPNAYKRKGSIFSRDIYSESWLCGN